MASEIYYSEKELAEILGLSRRTLQNWRQQKIGPMYIKLGRVVRYRHSDIEPYITENIIKTFQD